MFIFMLSVAPSGNILKTICLKDFSVYYYYVCMYVLCMYVCMYYYYSKQTYHKRVSAFCFHAHLAQHFMFSALQYRYHLYYSSILIFNCVCIHFKITIGSWLTFNLLFCLGNHVQFSQYHKK